MYSSLGPAVQGSHEPLSCPVSLPHKYVTIHVFIHAKHSYHFSCVNSYVLVLLGEMRKNLVT